MKNIKIRDVMTPIADYITINENQTLYDVFQKLEAETMAGKSGHRDLIVLDESENVKGKVTMIDIFRALEPNYQNLDKKYTDGTLTKEYVLKAVKEFDLWLAPVKDLCERGSSIRVSQVMHLPEDREYVDEDESVEKALHGYVMGAHQPLMVRRGDQVVGILRFEGLYKIIREHMLACRP